MHHNFLKFSVFYLKCICLELSVNNNHYHKKYYSWPIFIVIKMSRLKITSSLAFFTISLSLLLTYKLKQQQNLQEDNLIQGPKNIKPIPYIFLSFNSLLCLFAHPLTTFPHNPHLSHLKCGCPISEDWILIVGTSSLIFTSGSIINWQVFHNSFWIHSGNVNHKWWTLCILWT
jgi:hypothetical protein